jgi:hypothetical protein
MPRVLRNLRIDDVSSVDVGAGRGVKVVLTKRHDALTKHRDGSSALYSKPLAFGRPIGLAAEAYLKREFTQAERDSAAASGAALPDGSFPIHNKSDLKNAIQAIGRAKNPAKAKAHIRSRAKALGASDMIPESWSKRDTVKSLVNAVKAKIVAKGAIDFEEAQEMIEGAEIAESVMCELRECLNALDCSIRSILSDDDVDDKQSAIADSLQQFQDYVADLDLEAEDDDDDDDVGKIDMTNATASPAVQKMIEEAVAAAVAKAVKDKDDVIAKQAMEIVVAKMSEKHKAYHDTLGADDQKKFAAMSPADRDAEMEKTKKRAEDEPVYKQMKAENDDLRKRLAALEDAGALEVAKRDAKEMGFTTTDAAETLMKARRGDRDSMAKVEAHMRSLVAQRGAFEKTSKAFVELGTVRGAGAGGEGASANDEIVAKAAELRKTKPELSEAQAYDRVFNDPANKELRDREAAERMTKIHRAA